MRLELVDGPVVTSRWARAAEWAQRRQIAELRIGRQQCLAVVIFGTPAVLVGHLAPPPVGPLRAEDDPERLHWIDALLTDCAQVRPVIAMSNVAAAHRRPARPAAWACQQRAFGPGIRVDRSADVGAADLKQAQVRAVPAPADPVKS